MQELLLHLHIYGIWEDVTLKLSPRDLDRAANRPASVNPFFKIFYQTNDLPSVVHIALIVPRKQLEVFTTASLSQIGTPGFHISVSHDAEGAHNPFFAIQSFFGKLKPCLDSALCNVDEDTLG